LIYRLTELSLGHDNGRTSNHTHCLSFYISVYRTLTTAAIAPLNDAKCNGNTARDEIRYGQKDKDIEGEQVDDTPNEQDRAGDPAKMIGDSEQGYIIPCIVGSSCTTTDS